MTPIAHRSKLNGRVQTVAQHLTDVAKISEAHGARFGIGKLSRLIGLLHDFGKYSADFQQYIHSAAGLTDPDADGFVDAGRLRGKIDHSTSGAQFIWRQWLDCGPASQLAGKFASLAMVSHHSGLIDCLNVEGQNTFGQRISKDDSLTHRQECLGAADRDIVDEAERLLADPTTVTEWVEWLAQIGPRVSGSLEGALHVGLGARLLFSCLIDADRANSAEFDSPAIREFRPLNVDWRGMSRLLESHLDGVADDSTIGKIRRNVSEDCVAAARRERGIFTLTVPTGGGKTLAAMRFAVQHAAKHGLERIFYVAPFTSILDQNAQVFRDVFERGQPLGTVVLEHHSNLTEDERSWRTKVLAESWQAPIICTTMVQILESLFGRGTRGARRMHRLGRAVIILDEIQTLPIRCVHLFNNALNFLMEQCGSSVVLCTATQPLLHQVDRNKGAVRLSPDPGIIQDESQLFADLRRVELRDLRRPEQWSFEEIAELAEDESDIAGSCLVVMNTKRGARSVFEAWSDHSNARRFHLSTNMCPAHRLGRLAKILRAVRDREPVLCVSTQLIEAGVDVDFGAVIRALAGLDSIAQAAGRCNRHGRRDRGFVSVVNPRDERLSSLRDIQCGATVAERVLDDFREAPGAFDGDPLGLKAIAKYYRHYFFERKDEMDYRVRIDGVGEASLLDLLGCNSLGRQAANAPAEHLQQAFMKAAEQFQAIEENTIGVIVPYGDEGRNLIAEFASRPVEAHGGLLRQAQRYSIGIHANVKRDLEREGALSAVHPESPVLCLDERYYTDDFGLSVEGEGGWRLLYA